jgi:hypothetical protein
MRQRLSSANCTQRTPAGFPFGIPGIGLVMEGAMQQAPQLGRQDREVGDMACSIPRRNRRQAPMRAA